MKRGGEAGNKVVEGGDGVWFVGATPRRPSLGFEDGGILQQPSFYSSLPPPMKKSTFVAKWPTARGSCGRMYVLSPSSFSSSLAFTLTRALFSSPPTSSSYSSCDDRLQFRVHSSASLAPSNNLVTRLATG